MTHHSGDLSTGWIRVETRSGPVLGRCSETVQTYLGLPFAAPPVGPLRFKPPAPVQPWTSPRRADDFAPACPHLHYFDPTERGADVMDEDCLALNVWTPAADRSRRPVMVWIHGGGFEMGSGSSPLYHGEAFARSGVVLVTLNYRLGALGFLELGELDPSYSGSGNVGLLDQIAALEWVRDNIEQFGGDPRNVTIFGESAGAMSVSLLMTMPRARGLFHRAIAQSGAASAAKTPRDSAADTRTFMATAGIESVQGLVDAELPTLLAAHAATSAARMADPEGVIREHGNPLAFLPFRPVADGAEVPSEPLAAIEAGCAAGIPLVIGTTLEEWKLFALMSPPVGDEDALRERLGLMCTDPEGALAAYRTEHPDATLAEIECAALTDVVFRVPAVELADAQRAHAPVWQYRWDWGSPVMGGMIGASHAIEIPFVFDLVEDQRLHVFVGAEAPKPLARAVHESWSNFAATGAPDADGLPGWPALTPTSRPVLSFATDPSLLDDPAAGTLQFWLDQR